jgi:hypothetical protein
MGCLAYFASNTKKVVPRRREVAMRNKTNGEVHGFPWPGNSTASRRLTIVELIRIAPRKSIRPSFEEATSLLDATSLLGARGLACSVDRICNPRATRIKASEIRGTWPKKRPATCVSEVSSHQGQVIQHTIAIQPYQLTSLV